MAGLAKGLLILSFQRTNAFYLLVLCSRSDIFFCSLCARLALVSSPAGAEPGGLRPSLRPPSYSCFRSPRGAGLLCLHFDSAQDTFSFSVSSLIHWSLRRPVLNFRGFMDSPVSLVADFHFHVGAVRGAGGWRGFRLPRFGLAHGLPWGTCRPACPRAAA